MARYKKTTSEETDNVKLDKETFLQALQVFEFIKPYRWYFIGGLLMLFLSSMVFMLFPYLAGLMVDIAQGTAPMDIDLKDAGWILLGVLIMQSTLSYFRVILFANVSERGIADIRKALYARLINLPVTFFEKNRVGELVSRLTADVEKLYSVFSIILAEFIRQIIVLIVGILFLGLTTPRLAFIMLLTFPVIVVGAMFFGRYVRRLSRKRQKALAETNIILSETMHSVNTVKSFTNEQFELDRYVSSIQGVVKIALKFAQSRAIFSVFIITMLFGALFFIIWQGAVMIQDNTISAGQLVSFVSYTAILGAAIASLGNFYSEILSAVGATERIREILVTISEPEEPYRGDKPAGKFNGTIAFKKVHFSYPTRTDVEVLKGLDLTIEAGQKVALVGASGAGKSTIMQLLLQFYKIDEGTIYVDGANLYDYNLKQFRENIGIVPQEVLLFGGTIRENILYGKPDASQAEIDEAARLSNSMEFIESFPDGFETIVGERGVKLSGGQKQRIAIARALLKNPAILLLDEATSALDAESEKVVQDALYILMEGRTSIIIAHRLATVRDVDCIFVIDKGVVVEQGTHEELSLIDDGAYNSFAKLQFETT